MKLKALTLGLAMSFPLLASAAPSDTSVTLYGVVDTAIEYVNNIPDATGAKHSSVHFTNLTSSWPSYWGLRGSEKISDNLSAVFTLESGFNPGTGTSQQGGRLFGRQAFVGLTGDWGQVAFGRQYNMLMRGMLMSDFLGPNTYGLGTLDNYIPNTRMDNSITYMGNFSGAKIGLAYARGRDSSTAGGPAGGNCGVDYTDQSACSAYSAMLGYDTANWGVAGAYDVITGSDKLNTAGTGLANFQGLSAGQKDRRWTLNGWVKFNDLKVGLIYLNRKTDANNLAGYSAALGNRSDLWTLNAAYNFTPAVTLDGSVNYLKFNNASQSSNAWYYVARVRYNLSKRTSVYVAASYIKNKGDSNISAAGGTTVPATSAGGNQTAAMVGLRHNF